MTSAGPARQVSPPCGRHAHHSGTCMLRVLKLGEPMPPTGCVWSTQPLSVQPPMPHQAQIRYSGSYALRANALGVYPKQLVTHLFISYSSRSLSLSLSLSLSIYIYIYIYIYIFF